MTTAYIGVGSNIEPQTNIPRALTLLVADAVAIVSVSTFYTTQPLGRVDQNDYINGVICLNTDKSLRGLRNCLRTIEAMLGRVRTSDRQAAREIDLDILIFGDTILDDDVVTIPDPDILDRPFLHVSLLELSPSLVLPGMDRPLAELCDAGRPGDMRPHVDLTEQLKGDWNE